MSELMDAWDVAIPAVEHEKVYVGRRHGWTPVVVVKQGDSERRIGPLVDDLSWGVEWGYRGRGPTALARAVLCDHLEVVPPLLFAMRFRDDVIAGLPAVGFELRASDVAGWLRCNMRSLG